MLPDSLAAVRRVSTKPKATAFTLILNWPHSLASVFVRPHAQLAGRVVDLTRVAVHARDGGHVDDLAEDLAALLALLLGRLAHVGRGGAADPEWHDRVDVEHRLELLVSHLVGNAVARVAGVVDDDVELPELVDGLLDELVGHALLGQVAAEDGGLAGDLGRRLLRDVRVEVVDQDAGSVLREQLGRCPADASEQPVTIAAFPSSTPTCLAPFGTAAFSRSGIMTIRATVGSR